MPAAVGTVGQETEGNVTVWGCSDSGNVEEAYGRLGQGHKTTTNQGSVITCLSILFMSKCFLSIPDCNTSTITTTYPITSPDLRTTNSTEAVKSILNVRFKPKERSAHLHFSQLFGQFLQIEQNN